MMTILFVVLQITLILGVAGLIARVLMSRSPQLAADVCLLGLALSVLVIPLTSLPIPKLTVSMFGWTNWESGDTATANRVDAGSASDAKHLDSVPTANGALRKSKQGGVDFVQLLSQLRQSAGHRQHWATSTSVCWACWGIFAAIGILKLAMALPTIWRLKRDSEPLNIKQLQPTLEQWGQQHSALSNVRLRVSRRVTSPCVTWLDRKTIYLPESFCDWPAEEQQAVLAHEAAHLLRGDARLRLVFDLVRQVINFHPLSWFLKKQFVLAQEISADQKAGQLLSADRYRKGLCKLALRMDAQPQLSHASLGVSVSTNSLVRRIKMLSSPKRSQLRRWQQFLVVACVATVGGSVALCTADEPIRVASRVKKSQNTPALFTRYTSQPWEEIGIQGGYFRVLPSIAAQRPVIKEPMDGFAEGVGLADLDCGVELSRDWLSWTSNIDLKITRHGDGREHKYSISMLGDKPMLEFSREVDWVEVSEKANLNAFAVGDNRSALKKMLAEQGQSKTLRMVSNSVSHFGEHHIAKSLWPVIDGGVTAAVFPLAEVSKVDSDYRRGEMLSEVLQVARKCSFAGIGVDFQVGNSPCQVRLAFVPANDYSATTITEQAKTALAAISESMEDTDEMTDEEKATQARWRRELGAWTVTTKDAGRIGEIVLIEGAISDASLVFPLM
ncbi:MAG: hypothetical protein Aurels2KO_50000 [Aureliella sp.]